MIRYFLEGTILGLTTFLSCAITCLPVVAGIFSRTDGSKFYLKELSIFLAGRFSGYILIAIVASIAGYILKPFYYLKYVINLIVGILLILWGIDGLKKIRSCICENKKLKNYPIFVIGLLTGLSLCQPFMASILRVVEIANIFYGIIYFTGFFLVTSLIIVPSGLLSIFFRFRNEMKIFVSLLSLSFGIIFVISSIFSLLFVG